MIGGRERQGGCSLGTLIVCLGLLHKGGFDDRDVEDLYVKIASLVEVTVPEAAGWKLWFHPDSPMDNKKDTVIIARIMEGTSSLRMSRLYSLKNAKRSAERYICC